jgi:hypothetical protein
MVVVSADFIVGGIATDVSVIVGDGIAIDVDVVIVDAAAVSVIVGDGIAIDVDVVVVVYLGDKSVPQRNIDVSCRCSARNDEGFKYIYV